MTCGAPHPSDPETSCGRATHCTQCGAGWNAPACGPSHAAIAAQGVGRDGNEPGHDGPCGNWTVDYAARCARLELAASCAGADLLAIGKLCGQQDDEYPRKAVERTVAALSRLEAWAAEARANLTDCTASVAFVANAAEVERQRARLLADKDGQAAESRVAERVRAAVEAEREACDTFWLYQMERDRAHRVEMAEVRAELAAIRARAKGGNDGC